MVSKILVVVCALAHVTFACIGGGSGGGCCPQAAPSCGQAPRCPGPSSYVAPPSFGGYAVAPAAAASYAQAPPSYAAAPPPYAQAPPPAASYASGPAPASYVPPPPSGNSYAAPASSNYVKGK
uniref:VM domain-containing protein n=1 Tax=Panagrellus redivivus TaxID=6233 RepID=A0A7E4VH47_PANRE